MTPLRLALLAAIALAACGRTALDEDESVPASAAATDAGARGDAAAPTDAALGPDGALDAGLVAADAALGLDAAAPTGEDASLPLGADASLSADAAVAPGPATTLLTPPPGPFNGRVEVTLSTDRPADLVYTVDGSDPLTSPARVVAPSPVTLMLGATTKVRFYSETAEGAREQPRSADYVRAGGYEGTVSGVVVVGERAVNHLVGVVADARTQPLGTPQQKGDFPFVVNGLGTGAHRLAAFADTSGDGIYLPVVDLTGSPLDFDLDLSDPFKASLEGVRLYLGETGPGRCTIKGAVTFPKPIPNLSLSVAALSPNALTSGADPQVLLGLLGQGFRVTTNATDTRYPYELNDLEPGTYLPVPALLGASGGLSLNLLANLTGTKTCTAGGVVTADHAFGQVALSGKVNYTPASTAYFGYGAVAARSLQISMSGIFVQVMLMPALLLPSGAGKLQGGFSAQALKDNQSFALRAFSNLDPGGQEPFAAALGWALNPLSSVPAHATVTAVPPTVTLELAAP